MKKSGVLFGAALLVASAVHADGLYILGAAGVSRVDDNISRSDLEEEVGALSSFSHDRTDTGYKVQLGYQLNENFALEGGYVDLGESSTSASVEFTPTVFAPTSSVTGKSTVEAAGFNLDALLILPINEGLSIFFKAGIINAKVKWRSKGTSVVGGSVFSDTSSNSSTDIKPNFGLGVRFDFPIGIGLRAEAERFSKLGDDDETGEADVDLFSLGVTYSF